MRLRWRMHKGGDSALLEAEPADGPAELRARIEELAGVVRATRDADTERELLRLRHLAGIRILDSAPSQPEFASAEGQSLPDRAAGALPEYSRAELTPGLLRAAMLRDGCALVRRLIEREQASEFAAEIDRAYLERDEAGAGADSYYEEFRPHERFGGVMWRAWVKEGGGLLAADSPRLCAQMFELFEEAGLPQLICGYLGEPAAMSVHKTTLRKAEPSVSGAWHQDGFFMGPVRSLNVWVALSHCGDDAPGLDILPRRLDSYLATGTEGAQLNWTISEREVQEAARHSPVIRPVFDPGDALIFDELFLHKTGSDPWMSEPRFAIESWFFGGSAFPADYAPIAI